MLRQGFMNKYKIKSKFDIERFQKEDEGYLLKLTRPVKEGSIKGLSREKMNKFTEDILTNKKMTSILYDSNAKIEIKSTLKLINNFREQEEKYKKALKEKLEAGSVVKKRSRKEAYEQMRKEIDNFALSKERYKNNLLSENYKKYLEIKKDTKASKNEYINYLRKNRINSFRRAYDNLKIKYEDNMGKTREIKLSPPKNQFSKIMDNFYLFSNNYIDCSHIINLPDIKCDVSNVYSRLYNNKVLLTDNNNMNSRSVNLKKSKSRKLINLIKHPIKKRNNNLKYMTTRKTVQSDPKIKFNIKNALQSNGGKEFTVKITDDVVRKCMEKYSGGPEMIKYLKTEVKDNNYYDKINKDGFVNFYELTEKHTGNSYLHLAAKGNYPQLAQYFIEKGADINKKNLDGNTPLHIALKFNNHDIISILLKNKAGLDIPNNDGEIPFDLFTSEMKKKFGIDKLLIINPTKKS